MATCVTPCAKPLASTSTCFRCCSPPAKAITWPLHGPWGSLYGRHKASIWGACVRIHSLNAVFAAASAAVGRVLGKSKLKHLNRLRYALSECGCEPFKESFSGLISAIAATRVSSTHLPLHVMMDPLLNSKDHVSGPMQSKSCWHRSEDEYIFPEPCDPPDRAIACFPWLRPGCDPNYGAKANSTRRLVLH